MTVAKTFADDLSQEFMRQLLTIAERRSGILSQMKDALISQDYEKTIELAKLITGMDHGKEERN